MHVNHNRYSIDVAKIAYAESRLIISKRAFILMMPYRKNDICTISTFAEYRRILRHVCDNLFETENARTYFRNTFKQSPINFVKYYQLFCQKKNRFDIKKASLIDCFKRNVIYAVQQQFISYKNFDDTKSIIFQNHVNAYLDINDEIQQFRYRQPKFITISTISNKPKFSQSFFVFVFKSTIIAPIISIISFVAVVTNDLINLNFIITIVSNKSFNVSKIKNICNK